MAYWFLRSEPEVYGWDHLVRDGEYRVGRNPQLHRRNFLKDMAVGDRAILYHSNTEKACAGVMEVTPDVAARRREERLGERSGQAGRAAQAPRHAGGNESRAAAREDRGAAPVATVGDPGAR